MKSFENDQKACLHKVPKFRPVRCISGHKCGIKQMPNHWQIGWVFSQHNRLPKQQIIYSCIKTE